MMRRAATALFFVAVVAGAAVAAPAPSPSAEPVKAQEFLQRCKSDWAFCNVRIQAQMTELDAVKEACIPNEVKGDGGRRDAAAVRVAHVLEEVVEEVPDVFGQGEYKLLTAQIIALIWPCGVVS